VQIGPLGNHDDVEDARARLLKLGFGAPQLLFD
jgi:hypothetical protein